MKSLILTVLALTLSVTSVDSLAQPMSNDESIASQYLRAVETMNWSEMSRLLSPNAVFSDPTAETFGESWRFVGSKAIVDFYRREAENADTLSTNYRRLRTFSSGTRTVFELDIDVTVRAGMIGFPDQIIEDTMEVVTVIRVENDQVTEHTDYVDYAGMFERLEQHRINFEATLDSATKAPAP